MAISGKQNGINFVESNRKLIEKFRRDVTEYYHEAMIQSQRAEAMVQKCRHLEQTWLRPEAVSKLKSEIEGLKTKLAQKDEALRQAKQKAQEKLAWQEGNIPEVLDVCSESIKGRLEDEGIQARNLIKYNVPLYSRKKSQPNADGKSINIPVKLENEIKNLIRDYDDSFQPKECGDVSIVNHVPLAISTDSINVPKSCQKGSDYRARYWGQMMDTLKRTIDEIFSACEADKSEVECKEVIMILEHSKKDFHSLIEKMNLFKKIENSTIENSSTDLPNNKPVFIAWDERKISPGKPIMRQVLEKTKRAHSHSGQSSSTMSQTDLQTPTKEIRISTDLEVNEAVTASNFCVKLNSPSQTISESVICTWADKVKLRLTTNQNSDSKDPKILENNASMKVRRLTKHLQRSNQLKSNKTPIAQSLRPRKMSSDNNNNNRKVSTIDNGSDGEWETVCRSKFSQRGKLNKINSNQTLSDRPKRKSLLTKTQDRNNQYLRRNKSKSETNLRLSTGSRTSQTDSGNLSNMQPSNVIKYHSSILMSNDSELTDSEILINHHQHSCSILSSSRLNFFDSYQNKNSGQKTDQSIDELLKSCEEFSWSKDLEKETLKKIQKLDSSPLLASVHKDPVSTSVENSTDEFGDDDETSQNIRKLNKKLADVENTETQLQNELGRAQEEEKAYREQIEQEEAAMIKSSEKDLSHSIEVTANNLIRSLPPDDSDDGYDFVLNLNEDKTDSLSNNNNNIIPSAGISLTNFLLPFEEIKNKIDIFPLDWSQVNDDPDDDEFQDSFSKLRTPGRCVEMHQKLSAPSRKRSINSIQQLEKKQAKAKELREKLLLDRTEKVRELTKKVEEVRLHKSGLLDEKKLWMEQRLNKAETKRQKQLDERVKKAHDEEMKGKEIAFIQSLEAAQKQHTILTKHQESEARLLERQEERKKRMEEKAEREVAAEIRRKTLESNRQAWINDLQLRWKTREEELACKAENREKQRLLAVRAKEAEREQKKMVLEQQQKTQIQQLKEKISKKHEDSERRHLEQLAEISRKAFEMSIAKYSLEESADAPPIEPYINKKWCNVCNIMIDSDVLLQSHLSGKKHKNTVIEQLSGENIEKDQFRIFNLEHIVDAPDDKTDPKLQAKKDRRKAVKKRIKKIKQRIISNTSEFEKYCEQFNNDGRVSQTPNKQKISKFIKDIKRFVAIQDTGPWVTIRVTSLEKALGDLLRCLSIKKLENLTLSEKSLAIYNNQIKQEQDTFLCFGGMNVLGNILQLIQAQKSENSPILPEKTLKLVFKCTRKMCHSNNNVCQYVLFSKFIVALLDGLQIRLNYLIPDNFTNYLKNLNEMQSGMLPENRELPTSIIVEQILLTLTLVFENFVSNINSDSIYSAHHKIPEENSGRSSSLSNTSNRLDGRMDSQKVQDIISYVVSSGIVDVLSDYLSQVRGPLKNNSPTANFVLIILSFLSTLLKMLAVSSGKCYILPAKSQSGALKSVADANYPRCPDGDSFKSLIDHTQLLQSVEGTEMCGLVCLLYGLLLYQGNIVSKSDSLQQLTGRITISGLKLINNLAVVNLGIMQSVLSQEGTSLQLRHILSYLITYCNEQMTSTVSKGSSIGNCHNYDHSRPSSVSTESESFSVQELIHEVILCVGYFCVNNIENQNFVQTGQHPTILQQLCQLPFCYFSQKNLIQCLYPTLISCCYNNPENTAILESEMTSGLLSAFIADKLAEDSDGTAKYSSTNYDSRFELHNRFPISNWKSAKNYFDRQILFGI